MKVITPNPGNSSVCLLAFVTLVLACSSPGSNTKQEKNSIAVTITSGDKKLLLSSGDPLAFGQDSINHPIIEVDTSQRFQTIDGFGYTLTGGSAYLLMQKLSKEQRNALLKELFSTDENGIGAVSYTHLTLPTIYSV